MLDAAVHAIDAGRPEAARGIMASALERHRETIRSLRDLSFNIEPVVLRDQGFGAAVRGAREAARDRARGADRDRRRPGRAPRREGAGRPLPDRPRVAEPGGAARAADEDLGRDPRHAAAARSRRSSPTTARASGAGRRSTAIEERASTLNGRFSVQQGEDGGTAIHVVLPPMRATRGLEFAADVDGNGNQQRAGYVLFVWSPTRLDAAAARRRGRRPSARPSRRATACCASASSARRRSPATAAAARTRSSLRRTIRSSCGHAGLLAPTRPYRRHASRLDNTAGLHGPWP